jgi:hypothetical protein
MEQTKDVITNADSKGVIQDYYGLTPTSVQDYGILGRSPRFDPIKALKVIRNDPVVRAAAITLVDKVIESGWRIRTSEGKPAKEQHKKLKKLLFDRILRKLSYNVILYNNGFLEIVRKSGVVSDLNILETSLMKIKAEDNGDVIKYYQELGKPRMSNPEWDPKDLVHYKIDDFTSNVWAESNLESLYETVLIKDYIRQWLMWFFGTNQIRPVINIKDTNAVKVDELLSFIKGSERNLTKPLIFQGEVEITLLQSFANEGKTVMELLNWLDQQILMLMQVPPIAIGMPDSSGRSNSVEQFQSMNTRVYSIQKCIEDFTTNDLFMKINLEDFEFEFGVLDETTRTKVFENVQLMKQSQFTDEAIVEYLQSQGVVFETEKVLVSAEEIMAMSNKALGTGNEGMKGNKSADAAPSRARQNGGELSRANQKTMVKNSLPDYSKYPYVIDPR